MHANWDNLPWISVSSCNSEQQPNCSMSHLSISLTLLNAFWFCIISFYFWSSVSKYVMIWTFPLLLSFISKIKYLNKQTSQSSSNFIHSVSKYLKWKISCSEVQHETTMTTVFLFISNFQYDIFNGGKSSTDSFSNISKYPSELENGTVFYWESAHCAGYQPGK